MTDDKDIARIERERREREALFLLMLLGVVTESYRFATNAAHIDADPVAAARTAWLGNARRPGAVREIAEQLAQFQIEGIRRAHRLAGVRPPRIDQAAFDRIAAGFDAEASEFASLTWAVIEQKLAPALQASRLAGVDETIKAIRLAFKEAGVTKADPSTLEKGIERQVVEKHNAGLWQGARQIIDPKHHLVGFEFVAVLDQSTTAICRARSGVRLPPDHEFWRTSFPPCHWGCRSAIRPLFGSTLTGETTVIPTVPVAPGFGYAPSADLGSYFGVTR